MKHQYHEESDNIVRHRQLATVKLNFLKKSLKIPKG